MYIVMFPLLENEREEGQFWHLNYTFLGWNKSVIKEVVAIFLSLYYLSRIKPEAGNHDE